MMNNLRLKVSDHNEVQNQILNRLNDSSIMLKCLNLQQFMLADIHTISWYQILFQITLTQPSLIKKKMGVCPWEHLKHAILLLCAMSLQMGNNYGPPQLLTFRCSKYLMNICKPSSYLFCHLVTFMYH